MASKLDRDLQKRILEAAEDAYPNAIPGIEASFLKTDQDLLFANVMYLAGHGLLQVKPHHSMDKVDSAVVWINEKGLDFLADDGGLGAILGVVTVKLHDQTIKSLIEAQINQSDISPADKQKWTDQLRSLPAESIKHLTMELLTKGLENVSSLLPLLQKYMPL